MNHFMLASSWKSTGSDQTRVGLPPFGDSSVRLTLAAGRFVKSQGMTSSARFSVRGMVENGLVTSTSGGSSVGAATADAISAGIANMQIP